LPTRVEQVRMGEMGSQVSMLLPALHPFLQEHHRDQASSDSSAALHPLQTHTLWFDHLMQHVTLVIDLQAA
jgi:hypothetical protein